MYKECEKAMGKKKIRVSLSERILQIVIYIVVTIFVILCVYPFYYLIIYSLSDPTLAAKGIYLLPKGFTFSIYQRIFEKTNFGHAFLISASRTVINTGLCILGSSLFAYLVTKEDMIGRKFVYRFVVITMYIGAGLIPYYITMKAYHLKDTYFLYIIPGIINAFYVILIKTFIGGVRRNGRGRFLKDLCKYHHAVKQAHYCNRSCLCGGGGMEFLAGQLSAGTESEASDRTADIVQLHQ